MTLAYYLSKPGGREALKGHPRKPSAAPTAKQPEASPAQPQSVPAEQPKPTVAQAAISNARKNTKGSK